MPKLSFITKDGVNPKNRAKIFFCSHPDDQAIWLDAVSNDVFNIGSYTVFYDEDPKVEDSSFYSDLDEIGLCIVLVTRRFLTDDSYAKNNIFTHFKKNNTPIMPILIEQGIDSLFEEEMGDLHYIYRGKGGPSLTPYMEKLKKYLSLIFVGDDMVKRIQAAFDAYVFLSYRKTDRQYAKRLMSMIHDIDFCRDVAIWYDEFLTPGESFNDNIAEAISECNMFAMAVTPNIVAKGNYVVEKEYPMAKKAEKAIFPVEFLPTDERELKNSFEEIPSCISCGDDQCFAETLRRILSGIATRTSDTSPMHNFLIGLAYLDGIDVEVNCERGLRLINSAAECGLPEAIEKLVNMYCVGQYVEKNYDTAISWQKRLVSICEGKYIIEDDKVNNDAAPEYIRALLRMGEIYTDQMRYKDALPYVKKARSVANDLSLAGKDKDVYDSILSDCSLRLSEIYNTLKRDGLAMACILESFIYIKFPENYEEESEDRQAFFRKLISYVLLLDDGDALFEKKEKIEQASKTLTDFAEGLYNATGLEYDLEQYLKCLILSATKYNKLGKKDESNRICERILELLSRYDDESIPEEFRVIKCETYSRMMANTDNIDDSRQILQKLLDCAKYAESNEGLGQLGSAYMLFYVIYMKDGNYDEGRKMLLLSFDIYRKIARNTNMARAYSDLFYSEYLMSIFPKHPTDDKDGVIYLNGRIYLRDRFKEMLKTYPRERQYKVEYLKHKRMVGFLKLYNFFKRLTNNKH